MYKAECRNSKNLSQELLKARKMNINLTGKLQKAEEQGKINSKSDGKGLKKTRKRKKWANIKNEGTKRRRLNSYKDMLLDTLKQIEMCKKAQVTLWIGERKVSFSWSEDDFGVNNNGSSHLEDIELCNIYHDHTYCCWPKTNTEEHKDNNSIDLAEIFDANGQCGKLHLRRLIHVLDSYRISHEGYHELRMVSKGYLPPICRLAKEKKSMSKEIPYTKHPTVRFHNFFNF